MIRKIRPARVAAAWTGAEVLATWALFNPLGPTIWCLGVAERGRGRRFEVLCRCMHPMLDESVVLGSLGVPPEERALAELLQRAFAEKSATAEGALLTAVPSIVTCIDWEPLYRILPQAFAQNRAFREADWGRTLYYLDKYGSALFDRATEEITEAFERPSRPNYVSAPFSEAHLARWWTILTSPEFMGPALRQLAQAWAGSIYEGRIEGALTFKDVRDFLRQCGHPL